MVKKNSENAKWSTRKIVLLNIFAIFVLEIPIIVLISLLYVEKYAATATLLLVKIQWISSILFIVWIIAVSIYFLIHYLIFRQNNKRRKQLLFERILILIFIWFIFFYFINTWLFSSRIPIFNLYNSNSLPSDGSLNRMINFIERIEIVSWVVAIVGGVFAFTAPKSKSKKYLFSHKSKNSVLNEEENITHDNSN